MKIFRVQLYSLQLVGGFVLLLMGLTAIREGRFVQQREHDLRNNFTEISLVPLAAPLIAGPGMIAAAIAGCAADGWVSTSFSIFIAILINFILMLFSGAINFFLTKTHTLGPLIRLTGLIIAAVAMQMMITGIKKAFGMAL